MANWVRWPSLAILHDHHPWRMFGPDGVTGEGAQREVSGSWRDCSGCSQSGSFHTTFTPGLTHELLLLHFKNICNIYLLKIMLIISNIVFNI